MHTIRQFDGWDRHGFRTCDAGCSCGAHYTSPLRDDRAGWIAAHAATHTLVSVHAPIPLAIMRPAQAVAMVTT